LERVKERQQVAGGLEDDEDIDLCGGDDESSVLDEIGVNLEENDDFIWSKHHSCATAVSGC
jgi:hypothetical protein